MKDKSSRSEYTRYIVGVFKNECSNKTINIIISLKNIERSFCLCSVCWKKSSSKSLANPHNLSA